MTHDWIKQAAIEIHACHNITDQELSLQATETLIRSEFSDAGIPQLILMLSENINCTCGAGDMCWKCKAEKFLGI